MISLTPSDLPVGQPLPWSLRDGQGNLLLNSGSVLSDGREVALVFRHGQVCRPEAEDGAEEIIQAVEADSAAAAGVARGGPLGLHVGTLVQIKTASDPGRAAASRLIGLAERGLFVSWPQLAGRDIAFQAGEDVLLRGFTGRTVHSFQCTVTAVCRTPFRYLVLSEPREVESVPVRSSPRVPTRLTAQWTVLDGDTETPERLAVLSDLSTGGALVQTAAPTPAPGTRLRLRFSLRTAGIDSAIVLDAWVRHAARDHGDAEFPAFGVAFDLLGEKEAALLHCYIYEQLLAAASMAN